MSLSGQLKTPTRINFTNVDTHSRLQNLFVKPFGLDTVQIVEDGVVVDEETIRIVVKQAILDRNPEAVDSLLNVYKEGLVGKYTTLEVESLYHDLLRKQLNDSISTHSETFPNDPRMFTYTAQDDIIPACTEFVERNDPRHLAVAFPLFTISQTLGISIADGEHMNSIRNWINSQLHTITDEDQLVQVNNILSDPELANRPTVTILLGNGEVAPEPGSFAYIIHEYIANNTDLIIPFNSKNLTLGNVVTFVNAKAHLEMKPKDIERYWANYNKILDEHRLMDLDEIRNLELFEENMTGQTLLGDELNMSEATKRSQMPFSKVRPTAKQTADYIRKISSKLKLNRRSHNTSKVIKNTYLVPSRRDPDNIDKQGKMRQTAYAPDIHIYQDTSGSISEQQYRDTTKALIGLAKSLNVNLYYSSFSNELAKEVLVPIENRSIDSIYRYIVNIPKVSGGTDLDPIWRHINSSKETRERISLVISDMQVSPPNPRIPFPPRVFFLPIAGANWEQIINDTKSLVVGMQRNYPTARTHFLY